MTSHKRLLILSFSPIATDARVLKQVALFTQHYSVISCGFGPAPAGVVEHVQIPDGLSATKTDPKLLILRQFDRMYRRNPAITWVRDNLHQSFDVVLANDVEAVPIALELSPNGLVHADLHEFAPGQKEELRNWRRWIKPYMKWLVRRRVTRARSWTTVGRGLADQYELLAGFTPEVVENATPFADLEPTEVSEPIALVHSGAALRGRKLELMLEAVRRSSRELTLDLYLTPNDPAYLEELGEYGSDRIRFHDPVAYSELVATLNHYDVGVFMLPPVNTNYRLALPNKLFDFIQARLGIVIGPSAEMARVVTDHHVGQVLDDFSVDSLTGALEQLDAAQVRQWKLSSHRNAQALASHNITGKWLTPIATLMDEVS